MKRKITITRTRTIKLKYKEAYNTIEKQLNMKRAIKRNTQNNGYITIKINGTRKRDRTIKITIARTISRKGTRQRSITKA